MELADVRDYELCGASHLKNRKNERMRSVFMQSNDISSLLSGRENDKAALVSVVCSIAKSYRTYMPYFVDTLNEWVVIIIDNYPKSIHFVYARYEASVIQPDNINARVFQNTVIAEKIKIFMALAPSEADASVPDVDPLAAAVQLTASASAEAGTRVPALASSIGSFIPFLYYFSFLIFYLQLC